MLLLARVIGNICLMPLIVQLLVYDDGQVYLME